MHTKGDIWCAARHKRSVDEIIVAGLMRYGFVEKAHRISTALLEAADYSNGRLPKLFCGFNCERYADPVPYPTACSPQAWAATTPIMLIKSLMGYYPHVSRGGLWMDPALPESYGDLRITNAPMASGRITIDISGSNASIQRLPEGWCFTTGPGRGWLTWWKRPGSTKSRSPSGA